MRDRKKGPRWSFLEVVGLAIAIIVLGYFVFTIVVGVAVCGNDPESMIC